MRERKKLGDLLLDAGVLSAAQLDLALERQRSGGVRLGTALVDLELLTEEAIIGALSRQLRLPVVDLEGMEPDFDLLKMLPEETAIRHLLMPLERVNGTVHIAMADPLNIPAIDEVAVRFCAGVKVSIARERQVRSAILRHYGVTSSIREALRLSGNGFIASETPAAPYASSAADAAPVARLLEAVIRQAVDEGASDIHIEPDGGEVNIRVRIDGMLFPGAPVPKALQPSFVGRVKVAARMDISESRLPQDGRFMLSAPEGEVELRVSTFPTIHGENVVLRILRGQAAVSALEQTGLRGASLERAQGMFRAPYGVIAVAGPTGSGKTTTLYAALNMLNSADRHIITIEDPVEYRVPGVRQAQVNLKAGLTFAASLRSMLRQDPDVIMVGEVRDSETAAIALQAAMTGHLVLSTLHANDAAAATVRLADLGAEPYMIASSLGGVIAQRLVRRVCRRCKGAGCADCRRSGFSGRTGIFETFAPDEEARALIQARANGSALRRHAVERLAMQTMRRDGMAKAAEGITTEDEVRRVTADGG